MIVSTALVALGASLVAAVPNLEVQGSQFVNPKTGNRFQVVGMAYQPGGSAGYKPEKGEDPLTNKDKCLRDAALMQVLGVNTIRVYNLSPDLNHDECASIFNAAGIYMMLDVNSPLQGESLHASEPWTTYNERYLNRTFAMVEAFKDYPNTLVFFSGNEVIQEMNSIKPSPPYVRAVTRDLRNYVAKHASRKIPVGYSAADFRDVLFDSWNYFQCALDGDASDMSRAEVFALNSYSWCGDSNFEKSTYSQLVDGFSNTSVPVYYSEFGCNDPLPRLFTEIPTIYSDQMTGVFSGGIVYEYVQEANNYGLVDVTATDGSAKLLDDYNVLKGQYAKVDFSKVQSEKASSSAPKPPTCNAKLIKYKGFSNNFTIPTIPPKAKRILEDGVSPAPKGKLVDISDFSVKSKIYNPDGSEVTGLSVKPLGQDATNTPGTNDGAGGGKKNAGPRAHELGQGGRAAMVVLASVATLAGFTSLF